MKTKRFLLTAGIVLATAFTLSCSSDDSDEEQPSQNGGGSSSSTGGGGGSSSSGGNGGGSSSGGGGGNHFNPNITYGSFIDSRNGQTYKTVVIGDQTWMAENLNYDVPNNATDVCYDNDPANCAKYGRLYDWATAMNGAASSEAIPSGVQGVCPAGWHLPSRDEWVELLTAIGGSSTAGTKLKSAAGGWSNNYNGTSGNGTDDYGFSALPGGDGNSDGSFHEGVFDAGDYGKWWSATGFLSGTAFFYYMYFNKNNVSRDYEGRTSLMSVRCLKDDGSGQGGGSSSSGGGSSSSVGDPDIEYGSFIDSRDGKTYKTVYFGHTWFAENLNYNAPGSKCYDDNPANCTQYGRLYDWVTAADACPSDDWRLPTNDDWDELFLWIDEQNGGNGEGIPYDSYTAGKYLKAANGWDGTNKYGFSALPGGLGGYDGSFDGAGSGSF